MEITAALNQALEPTRSVIAERFHFHRRNQTASETIAEYLAALRQAALHCNFDALRDRLVGGLRTEAIQKRLLSETDLTLTNTAKIAQGMEAADRNTRSLKGTDPVIHQLTSRTAWEEATLITMWKDIPIHHLNVVSRMPNAMLVARKDTLLLSAGRGPNPRTKKRSTPRSSRKLMVLIWCKKKPRAT